MSRKPTLLTMSEGPSVEEFEFLAPEIAKLRLNTWGVSFRLTRELSAPILQPEDVEYATVAWVDQSGAYAANAKLAKGRSREGYPCPILDVYRLIRFDLELHSFDNFLVGDALQILTETAECSVRTMISQDGRWVQPRVTYVPASDRRKGKRRSVLVLEELPEGRWGLKVDSYTDGLQVMTGIRTFKPMHRHLSLGLVRVVLPWA